MTSSDAGSLKRGTALLRLLATAGARGASLTDLAARCGLPHPSAHRILKQLLDEGLAEHNPDTRRYRLGPLTFELGLAGSTMFDIRDLCEAAMRRLVEATEDTVYLVTRSGFDAVCAHRLEGAFPIRTLVLDVGSRRPLGVGAGGLAILAATPGDEQREIIGRVAPLLAQFGGLDERSLARACDRTSRAGFSTITGTVNLGVSAVGRAFRNGMGHPVGALSVAAMSQRLPAERLSGVAEQLVEACTAVEERLLAARRGNWHAGRLANSVPSSAAFR
jgi:DNA-binding IclR family transcriptional regulator